MIQKKWKLTTEGKKKKPESTEGIILHPNISVLNAEREERMGQESSKEWRTLNSRAREDLYSVLWTNKNKSEWFKWIIIFIFYYSGRFLFPTYH